MCLVYLVVIIVVVVFFFFIYLPGDILQASDDLSQVINSYKKIVEGQTVNGETEEAQQTHTSVKQGTF